MSDKIETPIPADGAIAMTLPALGDALVDALVAVNGGVPVGIIVHVLDFGTGGMATTTNLCEEHYAGVQKDIVSQLESGEFERRVTDVAQGTETVQ